MTSTLKRYAVNPTKRLHLKAATEELMYAGSLPDGKPDPAKAIAVNLYGPSTKEYAAAAASRENRAMDRLKAKGKSATTPEEKIEDNAQFLAACTASFENIEEGDGTVVTNDAEKILNVYRDREVGFIADQVSLELGNWASFSKPSAAN